MGNVDLAMDSLNYSSVVLDGSRRGVFEHDHGTTLAELMGGATTRIHSALPEGTVEGILHRYNRICLVGPYAALQASAFCEPVLSTFPREELSNPNGAIVSTLATDSLSQKKRVFVLTPASVHSRHNAAARADSVTSLLLKAFPAAKPGESVAFVVAPGDPSHAQSLVAAVGRVFPAYSRKTASDVPGGHVDVYLEGTTEEAATNMNDLVASVRAAAAMVDAPASELTTTRFVSIAREVASTLCETTDDYSPPVGHAISCEVTTGDALMQHQPPFGGLYGVGKASACPPSFVVLGAKSSLIDRNVVLVGKGIVYDTGGLSIKSKDGMPGMKTDMGGAAAVLQAFNAAVRADLPTKRGYNLHAILCLAENSVGPHATRPDDIHTMYSGKTVEINNTDAEGRLVLADGVAYASSNLSADVVIDMATLTGAQGVATGQLHAAVVCNSDNLEQIAVNAGKSSGDLVHPLPYCPEFYRGEFASEVADMKNSVKRRNNAQPSCAATFIEDHLKENWKGEWLHIDMAYPATIGERGTGYGVGLLKDILEQL